MSAVPSEYHGSSTQSCPQPTLIPMASISFTRVSPRRLGKVSCRPCNTMLISGLGITLICASAISGSSLET